ncbi:kinase-like protein, partial [Ceratobasidium sp. AG-I]
HLRVVKLLGMASFRGQIAMISPWMANGTMPQYLDSNPSAGKHELCMQIAEAVEYLHQEDVVHGDIKGANVLISERGEAKLGDFGNSVLKHASLQFTGSSYVPSFSIRWAAPELLKGNVRSSRPADIYALGMVSVNTLTSYFVLTQILKTALVRFGSYQSLCVLQFS